MISSCRYNEPMRILPEQLYSASSVANIDRNAIEVHKIPGYTLMRRAGQAVFDFIDKKFTTPVSLLVVCGAGNNAGDGYVLARIADQQGWKVKVVSLVDVALLKGDAAQACQHWCEVGEVLKPDITLLDEADVVVDAILGTGLTRDVSDEWEEWINAISVSDNYIISVDLPSGLNADTGNIMGAAIIADVTVCFIGLKQGMFTASGKTCCGEIIFDDLSVPTAVLETEPCSAFLLNSQSCKTLPARRFDTHKGHNGHVLVIGGNEGMPGAVILAAKSALRAGSGLVSVVTKPEHVTAVVSACPEIMVIGSQNGDIAEAIINKANCIVIGPGLGRDAWAQRLLIQIIRSTLPMVLDADALNIIANTSNQHIQSIKSSVQHTRIITPHPGEAARLLSCTVNDIQQDRFKAARDLYEKTGAIVVLKGSGTIIFDGERMRVCPYGNPAMSVAGMGDVLSGIVAACIAQGLSLKEAAATGVYYHAIAGDLAAAGHSRAMLSSDVIDKLPQVVN